MKSNYKVTFDDKTIFKGGDLTNSRWNEMPNKKIAQIEYHIDNQTLILANFKEYNHLVKRSLNIITQEQNITKLSLLAIEDSCIHSFVFDIKTETWTTNIYNLLEKQKSTGWKEGLSFSTVPFIYKLI
jgi:hypothetical protein